MHRIAGYIEKLLAQYDCVMIPSLGALIKETLPPSYQSRERMVYPGKDIFHFNPELKDRDNLLDNFYARNYGISLRRARLMVDRDVEELRGTLSSVGTVNLGKPGVFRLDESGKLLFMPNNTEEHLGNGENYGLIPYSLPHQLRKEEAIASPIKLNNSLEKSASYKKQTDNYLHFRIHKRIASAAAAVVVLLTILIPTSLPPVLNRYSAGFTKTEVSDTKAVEKGDLLTKENRSGKNLLSQSQAEETPTVEQTAAVAERIAPTTAQTSVSASNYYVVIGAFFSEEKAKIFIDGCRSSTFFSTIGYLKHGDRYMIYAYRTQSSDTAADFIRQLRETYRDKRDAWILHVAPK